MQKLNKLGATLALAESHSILVIEHDMEFVRQIARKVTVLHEGSCLFEGRMQKILVIEVYLGREVEPVSLEMDQSEHYKVTSNNHESN